MSETIDVQKADHVATVTLKQMTMKRTFFGECERVFNELNEDDELRAIVVCAAGKGFTYGLDLADAFSSFGGMISDGGSALPRTQLYKEILTLQRAFNAIEASPVPVIAAVHGWCIGGGLDMISACDIRVASVDAKFSLRETRIAIVADLGSLQRVPRIIGEGHARELAFTGKDIDAEHAKRIGLVNNVYADRDATLRAAQELAQEIAANPPLTVRGVKNVMNHSSDKTVAEGLDYVATWNSAFLVSDDLVEAATAFAAKRKPEFKGR